MGRCWRAVAGLQDEHVEASLSLQARLLEEYAADVLHGDFTIFATLEQQLKQFVCEHRQAITAWVPEIAPAESETRLVEKVQQSVPSQPVVVRRLPRRAVARRKRTVDAAGERV